jgi:outer membrane protein OmpA-like peptidoglycan-associated protein
MRRPIAFCVGTLLIALPASSRAETPAPVVPLCPGLTIVTAISQTEGDYESIKTIESVDQTSARLKYANERPIQDAPGGPTKIRRTNINRIMSGDDLANSRDYLQQFQTTAPASVPGTTAIGVSAAVLRDLKTKGEAELSIFDLPASPLSADPDNHPSIFDYKYTAKIHRVEEAPVMLELMVNAEKKQLPTIHATGTFSGEKAEFYFLDDLNNPLALRFRLGIGARPTAEDAPPSDRDTLRVVKIAYECTATANFATQLERELKENGRADIHSIYFSFNSDQIRPQSEPTLKEIADVLQRHADWKISIEGHTDAIGSDENNLLLSQRRSAAVKAALAARYGIDESRLTTAGHGEAVPTDTNDTPEGRAHNRRVELVRQ